MILPSLWLNDLGVLSYVSAGGVLSSLIVTVCVFCVGATKGVGFHGKEELFNLNGIPTALSLLLSAMVLMLCFPYLQFYEKEKPISQGHALKFCYMHCNISDNGGIGIPYIWT